MLNTEQKFLKLVEKMIWFTIYCQSIRKLHAVSWLMMFLDLINSMLFTKALNLCTSSRTESYLFPYLHKIERKNINLAFIIGLEVVEHLLHKWVWTVASICTEKFQQFSFKQPQNYKLQKQRYAISFRNPSFWNPWIAYKFISAFRCLAWLRVPAVFRLCSLSWAEQHL